nr:nicotinate-nucleotide adenylyltransferase [Maliibacterium massiliense]
MQQHQRIGLMGGTFDPIHCGHLEMAALARRELGLQQVYFVPVGNPPHKRVARNESCARAQMVQRAIAHEPAYSMLDLELKRSGYTYSIDTLRQLHALQPQSAWVYIIGTDTLLELDTWRDFAHVAQLCTFFAVRRLGICEGEVAQKCAQLAVRFGARISVSQAYAAPISSTQVRARIAAGKSWQDMVPAAVKAYIEAHGLYQQSVDYAEDFARVAPRVQRALSPRRWEHTLGVVETAEELARRFGCDVHKARLAALVHDCAKEIRGEDACKLAAQMHITFDAEMRAMPKLWHGPLGAGVAYYRYNIEDEDILAAVYYHSTGRRGMSKLEEIIKLADMIERGRSFAGLASLREISKRDLDAAVIACLENTHGYLRINGHRCSSASLEAVAYLEEKQARSAHTLS